MGPYPRLVRDFHSCITGCCPLAGWTTLRVLKGGRGWPAWLSGCMSCSADCSKLYQMLPADVARLVHDLSQGLELYTTCQPSLSLIMPALTLPALAGRRSPGLQEGGGAGQPGALGARGSGGSPPAGSSRNAAAAREGPRRHVQQQGRFAGCACQADHAEQSVGPPPASGRASGGVAWRPGKAHPTALLEIQALVTLGA